MTPSKPDGVVKSPIYGVVVSFPAPEKTLRLVYGPFYLAISVTFYEFINIKPEMQRL